MMGVHFNLSFRGMLNFFNKQNTWELMNLFKVTDMFRASIKHDLDYLLRLFIFIKKNNLNARFFFPPLLLTHALLEKCPWLVSPLSGHVLSPTKGQSPHTHTNISEWMDRWGQWGTAHSLAVVVGTIRQLPFWLIIQVVVIITWQRKIPWHHTPYYVVYPTHIHSHMTEVLWLRVCKTHLT